jgi:hypothetical protein
LNLRYNPAPRNVQEATVVDRPVNRSITKNLQDSTPDLAP